MRASVSQSTLTVTFSETLNSAKAPNKDRWNVAVNNSNRAVNSVAVSGANITLTLASAVTAGQAVTVGYWRSNTQPDAEDLAGNILLGFDGAKVNNGGPTVVTASSGYYADASLGTALTGPVNAGTKIYAKGGVQRGREPCRRHRQQRPARLELRHRRHGHALRHRRPHGHPDQRPVPPGRGDAGGRVRVPLHAGDGQQRRLRLPRRHGTQNTFNTALASAYTHATKVKIDNTAPTVTAAAVDGTALTVTFSEDMQGTNPPAATSFTLALDQGTAPTGTAISVTDSTATVTLSAAVADGRTVTLTYTKPDTNPLLDLAGNALATIPDASKVSVTNNSDTTGPKPTTASGYYGDANLTTALTGPVKAPTDIYVKVVFDETVGYTAGDGTGARPDISYAIGGTATRFDVISFNTAINTGDCRPTTSTPGTTYQCMYRVASGDNGDFDFRIGTGTADEDDNASAAYTHATKIAIDNTEPTFSSAKVNGATLTVTFSEKLKSTTPHANRWYVDVDEVRRTVSSTSITDEVATLTLSSAVAEGQKVTFRYQRTADNPTDMTDLAGNIVQAFGDETVTNETEDPGVKLSVSTLTIAEGATNGSFTAELKTQPSAAVTVALSSDNSDLTLGSSSLSFSTSTWNTAQTVTFSAAQDDDAADDTAIVTANPSGGDYDSAPNSTLTVTVTDDDTADITVSETSLSMAEGADDTFTVVLDTEPTGDVTVAVTSDNTSVSVDTDSNTSGLQGSITFTTENWDTAVTVTIAGAQDNDASDETATITVNPDGSDYGSVESDTVSVTVTDDDSPALTVASTLTVTEGGTGDLKVKLATQPTGDVTVTITAATGLSVDDSSLTFTTSDWNTDQTVTVTAGEDEDGTDDSLTLTLAASGADYGNVDDATVTVTVTDNDDQA